ncbi:MAG: ethanolamine ammonia-lyase reactivating factor EutA [Candidatus Thorarchaeota archaeon]|jgi:ethanolamine utilization protein EutA
MFMKTNRRVLLSVGVDIGSSTSHVVFSNIVLERDLTSRTEKFEIVERKILHSGPVHLTPFRDAHSIDFDALRDLILADYRKAGYEITAIDTGAVIITGETAKKENAEEIVNALAGEAGKFVAATAGPNFESVLAAYGSGAVMKSSDSAQTILHVDVGGGSSNMAVCSEGRIIATAATNVGGRLLAVDENDIIVRLEDTGKRIASSQGLSLEVGHKADAQVRKKIANTLGKALVDALTGDLSSEISKSLLMTPPLDYKGKIDQITFSGGVAEYIYGAETQDYLDLGIDLAEAIQIEVKKVGFPLDEPEHKIRATVIGAGQFNLQVSGSTTFLSSGLEYPLRNLPAVVPHIPRGKISSEQVQHAIEKALAHFDIVEGVDSLLLAFNDAVRPSYDNLTQFSKGVVAALPQTVSSKKPILMCFDTDIGNSVGNVMRRETGITNEILSIDEIPLNEGDFVDIGEPIIEGVVVPVVIKTLVFDSE